MKIYKDYLYFKKWFRSIEISIHQGQWSDENIAHSAFYEGMKYMKNQKDTITTQDLKSIDQASDEYYKRDKLFERKK